MSLTKELIKYTFGDDIEDISVGYGIEIFRDDCWQILRNGWNEPCQSVADVIEAFREDYKRPIEIKNCDDEKLMRMFDIVDKLESSVTI